MNEIDRMEVTELQQLKARIKALRRAARRGVTLVEVLIVVAIMAVISAGAALLVIPELNKAKVKSAVTGAQTIRQAIDSYRIDDPNSCPQMKDLIDDKKIDPKKTDDPWGKQYKVLCDEDDIHVISFGPDGQEGGKDDIRDDFKPSDVKRVANEM